FPNQATAGGLAGDFVGEAKPIPVKKAALGAKTIMPHKMAVITAFSRQIAEQSTPAIEPILRTMLLNDTRATVDIKLLDTNDATTERPPGLQSLATGADTAASTGNTTAQMIADLRGRLDRITSLNMGARLVWVMHPSRLVGLSFATNATGAFQFK